MILSVCILIIGIILCILGFIKIYKGTKYDSVIKKQNLELKKENVYLVAEQEFEKEKLFLIKEKVNDLKSIQINYENNAQQSFSNYCDILDTEYKVKEEEYNKLLEKLKISYDNEYDKVYQELENVKNELLKMKQTRAAALEAQRKEKEIEENSKFYSITLDIKDKNDIQVLNKVKQDLNSPRILSMLIWTTYFRDKTTELCNNVVGVNDICGIYKITNQITKECYIGQSVNISKRFKEHIKCGLDIDRPQGNKLYKAMIEYNIWNFTFEVLEECNKEQLNEKEKFYISLYDSCNYGYNSNKGIDKNT